MAVIFVCFLLLFAMAGHSADAAYCVCNTAFNDTVLQNNIDYACGAGADCSAILQNGACYNPNTVRDHCNYAVNSYYQRRGNIAGSCDFQGTANVTQTAPSAAAGCVYPSTPSGGGTPPGAGGTPNSGGTANLGPTANGFDNTDNGASVTVLCESSSILVMLVGSLILLNF